jgi:ElaB/YqjD/DUF883 family membrane-anchored ribosome-binding protein
MATNSPTKTPDLKDIKDKVVEGAHDAKEAVKGFAGQVGEKADDAAGAAGRGLQSVAETIRENTPDKGVMGAASRAVSDTIAKGGEYLENHQLSGMADDVTALIRNNPVPALLIAAGVGFLLARAMSRS